MKVVFCLATSILNFTWEQKLVLAKTINSLQKLSTEPQTTSTVRILSSFLEEILSRFSSVQKTQKKFILEKITNLDSIGDDIIAAELEEETDTHAKSNLEVRNYTITKPKTKPLPGKCIFES